MNKKSILKVIAAVGLKSAKIGNNSASVFGFHQPKEPAMLKKAAKKKWVPIYLEPNDCSKVKRT